MRTSAKSSHKIWKEKAVLRGKQLNRTKQELKRQKLKATKWRSAYYELKKDQSVRSVKNYSYPLELIWISILMHINFNVSLRGVSQSVSKLGELYGLSLPRLSHMSVRNWCLKFGLYCLTQPLAKGKYVLISDESIEIGRERLALLYVVPIEVYSPIKPLTMEDVKVLDLGVQPSWSSAQLAQKIKQKVDTYDLEIVYGISDNCSKLKKAMQQCGISWIGDCTHEIAKVSKALFKKDEQSNGFIIKMNQLRRKWILSKHTLLIPPELRTKDRFHQMFVIHKWAEQILKNWANISDPAKAELLFVQHNEALIKSMRQCYDLIDIFCSLFKSKGIQHNSLTQWERKVEQYKEQEQCSEKAQQFIRKMNDYLARQKATLPQQTQILCCSDIIESTFGKYKNKGTKIITDDVLKIAGYSKKSTLEQVSLALQKVNMAAILKWKQENTSISKLALLKRAKKKVAA
jgi:hypothetical protein